MDPKLEKDIIPKSKEGLKTINNLQWQPEMYSSLLTELQTNSIFRQCVDTKLGIDKHEHYDNFMKDVKNKDFKINKHLKFIQHACDQFLSLTPDQIKDCIDKLSYSEVLKNNICEGDITLTMIESYNLVLEFIGIHIDFKDLNDKSIIKLTPLIKKVLYKVIETSEYYEQTLCDGKTSKITKNLKTMYKTLFETRNTITYPFKDFEFDFFKDFGKTFYGKLILLLFIAFIFAQIVKLFSNRGEALQK